MDERIARSDDQGAGEQADRMEREAERMDERSSELGKDVQGLRSDWESKQQEDAAPGAQTEESLASEVDSDEEAAGSGDEGGESDGDAAESDETRPSDDS